MSSTVTTTNFGFIWELQKFSGTPKTIGHVINSLDYSSAGLIWYLNLYPNGEKEETKNFLSIYLVCKTLNPSSSQNNNTEVDTSFQVSILNNIGQEVITQDTIHLFNKKEFLCGFNKFISKDIFYTKLDTILSEDKIIISCKVHLNSYKNNIFAREAKLANDFEFLFLNESFSDATIIIGDTKFKVHKNVLSARSKVFLAIFQNDMKEKKENVIMITDIEDHVMKEVLRFIYCGKIENLKDLAIPLIFAADKYDVIELKFICEEVLQKSLDIENSCQILGVAELHNCNTLKIHVIDFITREIKNIIKTSGFKELTDSGNAKLVGDIVCALAEQKK